MTRRESGQRARAAAVALLVCAAISLTQPLAARADDSSPVASRSLPSGWETVSESSFEGRYESGGTSESRSVATVIVDFLESPHHLASSPSGQEDLTAPGSFAEFKSMCDAHSSNRYPDSGAKSHAEQTGLNGQPVWKYSNSVESSYSSNTEIMIFNPSNGGGTWVFAFYEVVYDRPGFGSAGPLKSQVNSFLNSLRFKQAFSPEAMTSGSTSGPWDSQLSARDKALYWLLTKTPLALMPHMEFDEWSFILGSIASFLAAACAIAGIALSIAMQHRRKVSPRTPVGFALHMSSRQLKVGRDRPSTFTAKAWRVLASGTPEAATDVTVSVAAPEGVAITTTTSAGTLQMTLLQTAEVISPAHLIVTATAPTGGTQAAVVVEAE
jgi:hypothetical protein